MPWTAHRISWRPIHWPHENIASLSAFSSAHWQSTSSWRWIAFPPSVRFHKFLCIDLYWPTSTKETSLTTLNFQGLLNRIQTFSCACSCWLRCFRWRIIWHSYHFKLADRSNKCLRVARRWSCRMLSSEMRHSLGSMSPDVRSFSENQSRLVPRPSGHKIRSWRNA